MDTTSLPQARAFYQLADGRVSYTKTLLLSEGLNTQSMQLLGRAPFTRTEVLSRELQDPTEINFGTFLINILSGRKSRSLRVVDGIAPYGDQSVPSDFPVVPVANVPPAAPDNYTFPDVPEQPYDWPSVVGIKGVIAEDGSLKPVMVLDSIVDTDLPAHAKLVVQLADQNAAQSTLGQELMVLVIERDSQVAYTNYKAPLVVKTGPNQFVRYTDLFKIKVPDISTLTNFGKAVSLTPLNNTVSAHRRGTGTGLLGVISFSEVSDNHFPSAQAGRTGRIRFRVQTQDEQVQVADPVTGAITVETRPVTRQFLSYSAPEMPDGLYGTEVDVSSATGGLQCDFALRASYDADDGEGGTFPKDLKLVIKVSTDLYPSVSDGQDGEVEIRSSFWKTPDGRPLLGSQTSTLSYPNGPGTMASIDQSFFKVLDGLPGWIYDELVATSTDGVTITLPVDDQGLYLWNDPSDPERGGLRTYPTASFEAWFRDTLDTGEVILQKESADKNVPIWIVAEPTPEFDTFIQDAANLRPQAVQPEDPDFKVYPYRMGTPRDLTVDPEQIMNDVDLHTLNKSMDPDLAPPIQGVKWIKDPDSIYFFFVLNQSDCAGIVIAPTSHFKGRGRFGDGDLSDVLDYPMTTQLSGTGEPKPPGLTQTILVIYPRPQVPSKASGPQDALDELARTCGGTSALTPDQQADLLDQVDRLTAGSGVPPKPV